MLKHKYFQYSLKFYVYLKETKWKSSTNKCLLSARVSPAGGWRSRYTQKDGGGRVSAACLPSPPPRSSPSTLAFSTISEDLLKTKTLSVLTPWKYSLSVSLWRHLSFPRRLSKPTPKCYRTSNPPHPGHGAFRDWRTPISHLQEHLHFGMRGRKGGAVKRLLHCPLFFFLFFRGGLNIFFVFIFFLLVFYKENISISTVVLWGGGVV